MVVHSGRSQNERERNLEDFKKGFVRFLIATDVAARGIDIKALPFVVNFTMPAESEDYIHRVGRVGRADMPGIAISFVATQQEKVWFHANCNTRGVGCYNTNLVKHGGCCVWFDEMEIFKAVEDRLGGIKIPVLKQDEIQPDKVQQLLKNIEMKDPLVAESAKKVEALLPRVEELSKLEITAQNHFLTIPAQFNNYCNKKKKNQNKENKTKA